MASAVAKAHDAEHAELATQMRACLQVRQAAGLVKVVARPAREETAAPPQGWKRVSFIRHGEGYHNVAQSEWIEAGKPGEPYTVDNDPDYRFGDADLTDRGRGQARELQGRAAAMTDVEVIIVSPMRRATYTALIGFERAVAAGVPVVAHELCHETGGRHTCDKRLPVTALRREFPKVDYSQGVPTEEDPYWHETERETREDMADRGGKFVDWLMARPEKRIVVAAHSAWLASMFAAAVESQSTTDVDLLARFQTAEMRTVLLAPRAVAEAKPQTISLFGITCCARKALDGLVCFT